MKEPMMPTMPRGYKPAEAFQEPETAPAWEKPDSFLFVDWYMRQNALPVAEQAPAFQEFLEKVAAGEAELPSVEQIARYKISELRNDLAAPEDE